MDGIGSALIAEVRPRVDADEQLDVGAGLLVLAALEGDAALDQALVEDAGGTEPTAAAEVDPAHAPAARGRVEYIGNEEFAAAIAHEVGI